MGIKRFNACGTLLSLTACLLSSCYHPPYNNFQPYNRTYKDLAVGATAGSLLGAVASAPVLGAGIGAAALAGRGFYTHNRLNTIKELEKRYDIQYEPYGDTVTFIVPTDRYFIFNSADLNEVCYPGLETLLQVLSWCKVGSIYVAGFTDNVGSRYHKNNLTQAQAETMLTFLWANGINANRLTAEGYADKYPIADNKLIHGSAQNRRIEIQCINFVPQPIQPATYLGPTK